MDIKNIIAIVHPAGWPFVCVFAIVGLVLTGLLGAAGGALGIVLLAWCVYFFRDPVRVTPTREGLIVSPADGRVVAVASVTPDADLGLGVEQRMRISIFLNVFDVHVNRVPVNGIVVHKHYRPGKFVNASLDKASVDNERAALTVQIAGDYPYAGRKIGVVQIAGLIARRIICNADIGQSFKAGERYGLIRFGSRTDVYLPPDLQPLVVVGQRMIGGETVLADCLSNEPQRQGEAR
ncbi:MAG: phosphatidylserine decarboxylase [Alphaproteobacteria bacterium]|nr:phosphatidylserine decarboxylase [Alphaproteobacteria bacterium]